MLLVRVQENAVDFCNLCVFTECLFMLVTAGKLPDVNRCKMDFVGSKIVIAGRLASISGKN